MKYFLDTEFYEHDKTIELLSIGIVTEDGREYYAETGLALEWLVKGNCPDDWLKANVVPHFTGENTLDDEALKSTLLQFCDPSAYGKPEFWGYYADYDWVVFCWLFGRMIDLPKGFPMYCRDVKQWADTLGNPRLPKQETTEHNALTDARDIKAKWQFLCDLESTK